MTPAALLRLPVVDLRPGDGINPLLQLAADTLMSADEERELFTALVAARQRGDTAQIDELTVAAICYNIRLVVYTANNGSTAVSIEDRCSAGLLGLLEAIKHFDPSRGLKFSTYAVRWIASKIQREAHASAAVTAIPTDAWTKFRRLRLIQTRLRSQLGREATDNELCQALYDSLVDKPLWPAWRDRIYPQLCRMSALFGTASLNQRVGEQLDTELYEFFAAADDTAEEAERLALASAVNQALECLDPRDRVIIRLFYGLDGRYYTVPEIAEMERTSETTIYTALTRARRRLRKEAAHLTDWL